MGTYDAATGLWAIGNMGSTATANLTMLATVNKTTGNYTNTAVVSATETDNSPANNTGSIAITANNCRLPITMPLPTNPNTPVSITVLANDVKGLPRLIKATVTIIRQPVNGTVAVNTTTGVVLYTPATNYYGTDNFTYTVKDINGMVSNVATVTIKINDAPVIGIAKAATATVQAINGSYDITYLLTVGNYGITDLNSISIKDDLSQTFRGERIQLKSISSLGVLKVNTRLRRHRQHRKCCKPAIHWLKGR